MIDCREIIIIMSFGQIYLLFMNLLLCYEYKSEFKRQHWINNFSNHYHKRLSMSTTIHFSNSCKQVAYRSIYIITKLELMSFLSETHSESTWYIVVYDKQNKYCNSNNCVMRAHFYGYLLLRISMKGPCHKHIKHQTCLLKVNILCSMS